MRRGGRTSARPAVPLVLTLLVHLLLVLAWMHARTIRRESDRSPGPRFVLVPVRPVAPPRPLPERLARRGARPTFPVAARPPAHPPATALPGAAAAAAAEAASAAPGAADILARARQDAGRIDRELRGGKPAAPGGAPGRWARFQAAAESAFIDRSNIETMDTYTAPDGVVIYRFRQGNKVRCRMTGSVGPGVAGGYTGGAVLAGAGSAGGGNTAGTIACPSGQRDWVRR